MVMCHLPVTILLVGLMPVELLPIESVTEQDMFFEQGNRLVIYNIYKNRTWKLWNARLRKLPGGFRIFLGSFEPYSPSSGLGLKNFSNFWSCIDLGHILKNRVLAPIAPNVKTSKEIFFSNSAKLQHIFKINSGQTWNQMNLCLVELKMKDYFKTGCFASKWLIKVEAKGTNQSFGVDIETKLKRRVCVFRWLCVICRSPFCWWGLMPVELLPIESVTQQDMFFEQGNRLVIYIKIGLENFEIHDWGKLPGGFRIFLGSFEPYSPSSGLGLKIFSNFWSCIDLGHILKNRVLAPFTPNVKLRRKYFFQIPQNCSTFSK